MQITYRQHPLSIHTWARDSAELSVCVALQDRAAFWKLHDFFFDQQQELSKDNIHTKAFGFLAQQTNIDTKKITSCLAEKRYQESLHRDEQLAMDFGITVTPTIFLNGRKVGIRSVEDLRTAIKSVEAADGRTTVAQERK